ncbi:MAG: hypothetical protein RLZZ429_744 [Bacteroidota bacterium]
MHASLDDSEIQEGLGAILIYTNHLLIHPYILVIVVAHFQHCYLQLQL